MRPSSHCARSSNDTSVVEIDYRQRKQLRGAHRYYLLGDGDRAPRRTPNWMTDQTVSCVLCGSADVALVETLTPTEIIHEWSRQYGINISSELRGAAEIELWSCEACGLRFFVPPLAGSERLYEQLESFDFYYMPHKWEYDRAVEDIGGAEKVLEVGCGRGDFVARVVEGGASGRGIELNRKAVCEAIKAGRPVESSSISDVILRGERFDVVCAFQVVEHVPRPLQFLSQCLDALKTGGLLLLAVPNSEGFLRHAKNDLLNQPPHHVTRWSRKTFESLERLLPAKVERVLHEPLADYHLSWYADIQMSRLPYVPVVSGIAYRLARHILIPLARATGIYKRAQGHTIYARFRKT